MQLSDYLKVCLALSIPIFSVFTHRLAAAEAPVFGSELMPEPRAVESKKIQSYFVRLPDAPMSQWLMQRKNNGDEPSRAEKQARVEELKKKLAEITAVFDSANIKMGSSVLMADLGFTVYATPEQIIALGDVTGVLETGVLEIVPNTLFSARVYKTVCGVSSDPGRYTLSSEWTGLGQTIAIIDSGIDYTHEDFGGAGDFLNNDPNIVESGSFPTARVVGGYDFVGPDYDPFSQDPEKRIPRPDLDPLPISGVFDHGTSAAGAAAGNGYVGEKLFSPEEGDIPVGSGVAPEAGLFALKVVSGNNGRAENSLLAEAINFAMDPNGDGDHADAVDVINLSYGSAFGHEGDVLSVAIKNAIDSGIVVVKSAGNAGDIPYVVDTQPTVEGLISVAATELDGNSIWCPSSKGPAENGIFQPDISAPGSLIYAPIPGYKFISWVSGTSFSAPAVAGAAALVRQKFPKLAPRAVKAILQNSSRPIRPSESSKTPLSRQGTGVLDVEKALQASSYAAPGGIGFGVLEPEYYAESKREFTLHNFSEQDKLYEIRHEPNLTLPEGVLQLSYSEYVFVAAGTSTKVPVTLHINAQYAGSIEGITEADGWLVASSDEEELRVGYMAMVKPTARLEYSVQNKQVSIRNDAFATAQLYPFTLVADERSNALGKNDIQSLGFRTLDEGKLAFGVKLNQNWRNFSEKKLLMFIDVDGDNNHDFWLTVEDAAYVLSQDTMFVDPVGKVVTTIRSTDPTNDFFAQYATPLVNLNSSVLVFDFQLYGEKGILKADDSDFSYAVAVRDEDSSEFGTILFGSIDLEQEISFDTGAIVSSVPSGSSVDIKIEGDGSALWLSPTERHERNAVVLP